MRKAPIIILILVIVLGLAIAAYFYWRDHHESEEIILYGNVDVRQVDIAFRIAGRIAKLHFEEGDFVPAGALMATLDKSPYDSQISQAQANRDANKATLENAKILLSRRQQAVGFGGVSQEDLDNALYSHNQLLSNYSSAEAALNIAHDNMTYTEIKSPTDGIILSRIREPGTVVNPTDPVYILSVTSPVWIRAFVDEPDLGLIYYGMKAEVHTDSGRVYYGKIGFISPMAEFTPKTVETTKLRSDLVYRLRIYADNPDKFLKQGMPVTVKLHKEKRNTGE